MELRVGARERRENLRTHTHTMSLPRQPFDSRKDELERSLREEIPEVLELAGALSCFMTRGKQTSIKGTPKQRQRSSCY